MTPSTVRVPIRTAPVNAGRLDLGSRHPIVHLTRWRIELARDRFIRDPSLTIADIAESVGYATEAAFSVAFRRHTGLPPGAYRKRFGTAGG